MRDYAWYLYDTEAWGIIYCGKKRSDTQNEVFSFNSIDICSSPLLIVSEKDLWLTSINEPWKYVKVRWNLSDRHVHISIIPTPNVVHVLINLRTELVTKT